MSFILFRLLIAVVVFVVYLFFSKADIKNCEDYLPALFFGRQRIRDIKTSFFNENEQYLNV